MASSERLQRNFCTKIVVSFALITFHLHLNDAFQTARPNMLSHTQLQEKNAEVIESDARNRRTFIASTCTIALMSLTAPSNIAIAEDNQPQDSVITTPTISEGELTASSPPPNRVKEVVALEQKKSADPRFFIAGGASAAISHGITTPIDVVKTRMQTDLSLANASPIEAAINILENEGPEALSAGLGPTVIGYGMEGALKFGVYESLKPIFSSFIPGGNSGEAYLAAAICAGALASIILCPMEETRIRLVTDPSFGNGLFDGLPRLLKEEGALSPFVRGLPSMLSKQVPYTMGKQVSFDIFAAMLYSFLVGLSFLPQKEIALEVEIGAAFLASIVACLSSHPGDVLLTSTYKSSDGSEKKSFFTTIKNVYNDGGIPAFFRGLNARFLHVGCIITFQLVIYDQIKQALGLPASGSS